MPIRRSCACWRRWSPRHPSSPRPRHRTPPRRATEPGVLTVGTRGSALALAQTELVLAALRQRWPELETRVERITTTGDVRRDVPLSVLGRGAFVSEIEAALRDRRIDI